MKGFLISCFISIILLSAFTLSQESPELSHSKINYISLSDMYGSRIRNSDVELKIIIENKEHHHFNLVSDDVVRTPDDIESDPSARLVKLYCEFEASM